MANLHKSGALETGLLVVQGNVASRYGKVSGHDPVTRYNSQNYGLAIQSLFRMYATKIINKAFRRLQDPPLRRFVLL